MNGEIVGKISIIIICNIMFIYLFFKKENLGLGLEAQYYLLQNKRASAQTIKKNFVLFVCTHALY